MIKLYTII